MSSSDANTCTKTFAPLVNCVVDDAFLETMPDIDPLLLQFIDVMIVSVLLCCTKF